MRVEIDRQLMSALIIEQEERVARQAEMVQRLEAAGLPATGSRAQLGGLQKLLTSMRARAAQAGTFSDGRNHPNFAHGA